jgi:ribosomal protein S18 acetylase RimI-like enzyme
LIKIAKARKSHLPGIVEVWKEFMDFHRDLDSRFMRSRQGHKKFREYIAESIGSRKSQLFVALDNVRIIGYGLALIGKYPPVFKKKSYGIIADLAVNSEYRRKGTGEAIYKEILNWFKGKGISRIELSVATKNRVANSFWSKMGFSPYMSRFYMEIESD